MGLNSFRFCESVERAEPGGLRRVAVDEDDDGDGAGPVAVSLVAGHEGRDKPGGRDGRAHYRELKSCLLESFQ